MGFFLLLLLLLLFSDFGFTSTFVAIFFFIKKKNRKEGMRIEMGERSNGGTGKERSERDKEQWRP